MLNNSRTTLQKRRNAEMSKLLQRTPIYEVEILRVLRKIILLHRDDNYYGL